MTIDTKHGRELYAAATPGEWTVGVDGTSWVEAEEDGFKRFPATDCREDDADFIAWAHNNAPALLDAAEECERLRATLEAEQRAHVALMERADVRVELTQTTNALTAEKRAREEAEAKAAALKRHYDAAGPEHNLLALLDLYHERTEAAEAKAAASEERESTERRLRQSADVDITHLKKLLTAAERDGDAWKAKVERLEAAARQVVDAHDNLNGTPRMHDLLGEEVEELRAALTPGESGKE